MSEKTSVELSTKSWHFKLVTAVLGSAAPTPDNMHNLCPYFWLMIFSILVSPIVLPIKAVVWLVSTIVNGIENFVLTSLVTPQADNWYNNLSDLDAYRIWLDGDIPKKYKRVYGDEDNYVYSCEFVYKWFEEKYQTPANEEGEYYSEEFRSWKDKTKKEYADLMLKINNKREEKQFEKEEYEEKMEKVREKVDNFFTKIGDAVSSWKNIIKWTKRFVGLIVTLLGLAVTYFIVNFSARGILWVIENWNWAVAGPIFGWVLVALVAIGALVGITYVLSNWFEYMKEHGTSLWYVRFLYAVARVFVWPFKIIFYRLLLQTIIVNFAYLVVKVVKAVWKSILGFFGIFGEYFGASYTDYCPGIEWKEVEDKRKMD